MEAVQQLVLWHVARIDVKIYVTDCNVMFIPCGTESIASFSIYCRLGHIRKGGP
jgi:hypothetical protein